MNDALDADKSHGLPLCFLDLDDANQLIISKESNYMLMLYCWGDYEDRFVIDKYLAMQFFMN